MGSYTWKDSSEYTSGTTSEFIKSWDLNNIYNNYVSKNIPRYSKISKVTFSIDAKQNLSLSKGSIGAYFGYYENDVAGDDVFVCLPDKNNAVTNSYQNFSNEVTSFFVLDGSSCGRAQGFQPYGILKYLSVTAHATVIRKHSFKNVSLKFDYNDQYTISTSVSPSNSGTVSGGGTKTAGTTISLTANPATGYEFKQWSDGNTSNPRSVTVTGNATYTAQFTKKSYTISASGTNGTVTGGGTYEYGTTATLTATPNSGYKFVKWSDENTSNPRTITVSGNATYTAVFEKSTYTITFKNADGSVVSTKTLNSGATLGTLPTVSRNGYTFGGWIPCAPAVKTDNSILDSYQYNGSTAYPLNTKYKYTNKFAIHIEAYMNDWSELKTLNAQIMSCTEGGGWGLGYQARSGTTGGTEIYNGSGYKIIDLGFASDDGLKALNNNTDKNKNWHSIDLVFSEGTYKAYLDGVEKGTQTLSSTSLSYNASNTIFVGAEASTNVTTPASNSYFKGYISNVFIANQGTKLQIATTSTIVNSNIDYYPIWRKNIAFTATFKNHDGTTLQTVSVEYGNTPNYTGSTPTKSSTAEYSYSFSGWSPSIGAITSDTTYVAQFTATKRKYTINFVNYDNSPLETKEVDYGDTPTYTGATPQKPSDTQYDYAFSTWSPSIVAVTGAATYKAVFNSILKYYTVLVTDGVINLVSGELADGKYSYGSVLKILANEKVGYKFVNWSGNSTSTEKEIPYTVTGNASFVANYRALQLKFKSVKIYYPTEANIASPDNPLIANEKAQIVVQIALE